MMRCVRRNVVREWFNAILLCCSSSAPDIVGLSKVVFLEPECFAIYSLGFDEGAHRMADWLRKDAWLAYIRSSYAK